jgi:hypothetical protein
MFFFRLFRLLKAADSFFMKFFLFIGLKIAHGLAAKNVEIFNFHVDFDFVGGGFCLGSDCPVEDVEYFFGGR